MFIYWLCRWTVIVWDIQLINCFSDKPYNSVVIFTLPVWLSVQYYRKYAFTHGDRIQKNNIILCNYYYSNSTSIGIFFSSFIYVG